MLVMWETHLSYTHWNWVQEPKIAAILSDFWRVRRVSEMLSIHQHTGA